MSAQTKGFSLKAKLVGLSILIGSNTATYVVASSRAASKAIRDARVGWVRLPGKNGTISVDYQDNKTIPKTTFTPEPLAPYFRVNEKWNSPNNKEHIEHSIKFNMSEFYGADSKPVKVASASCLPLGRENFWECDYRELGAAENTVMIVEVNPSNGDWQSR